MKEFNRKIRIDKVIGMTKSVEQGNYEIVVHIRDQHDLRVKARSFVEREEIIESLGEAHYKAFNICLPVYGVKGSLLTYTTTESDMKANRGARIPSQQFALADVRLRVE